MSLLTGGLHHLSIRTTDLGRAKRFYTDTLGFQLVRERDGAVLLNAHGILFGVLGAAPETSPEDRFDPFRLPTHRHRPGPRQRGKRRPGTSGERRAARPGVYHDQVQS